MFIAGLNQIEKALKWLRELHPTGLTVAVIMALMFTYLCLYVSLMAFWMPLFSALRKIQ